MSEHNLEHHEAISISPSIASSSPASSSPTSSSSPTLCISRDNTDSVVYSIIQKFKRRADFGKKKYNTDLDRKDLSLKQWYNHLHEELFDSILYLEKIMQEIEAIEEK